MSLCAATQLLLVFITLSPYVPYLSNYLLNLGLELDRVFLVCDSACKLIRGHIESALKELSLESFALFEDDLYDVRTCYYHIILFGKCICATLFVYECNASLRLHND